jgi:hypothetical protein
LSCWWVAGLVETPGGLRIANFASVADLSAILQAPRGWESNAA